MAVSSFSDTIFISLIVAKFRPFMGLFIFGNRKVKGGQVRSLRLLRHNRRVVLDQKTTNEQAKTCELAYYCGAMSMTGYSTFPDVFFRTALRKWRIIQGNIPCATPL